MLTWLIRDYILKTWYISFNFRLTRWTLSSWVYKWRHSSAQSLTVNRWRVKDLNKLTFLTQNLIRVPLQERIHVCMYIYIYIYVLLVCFEHGCFYPAIQTHRNSGACVCRHTQTHTHPYVSTYMSADLSLTLENSANFYHPLSWGDEMLCIYIKRINNVFVICINCNLYNLCICINKLQMRLYFHTTLYTG